MKYFSLILAVFILLTACRTKVDKPEQDKVIQLSVFTTRSNIWDRDWLKVYDKFQTDHNCQLNFTFFENSCLLLEELQNSPEVDVVIGLDNINYLVNDLDSLFIPYQPKFKQRIIDNLIFDDNFILTPIAYGDLSFIINTEEIPDPPYTFGIMQDGMFKRQILFPDPRSSSLGKAFLLWSVSTFGTNGYGHFWRSIKENIHTVTDNWDKSYNIFLAGEASIVLGFSTIPYYHLLNDSLQLYAAFIPSEGGFRLIEAAGIYYKTKNLELSKDLIDFLIGEYYQNSLITDRWIKPVTEITLPAEISNIPESSKDLTNELSRSKIRDNFESWLKRWIQLTID